MIYRYIFVLLDEVKKITLAYSLRAPGQKGIHFKVWGSLVGNLFLRTMDRSTDVYEAMCLRGFSGDFTETRTKKSAKQIIIDLIYFVGLSTIFICFRIFPIFTLVGNFIGAIL